MKIMLLKDVAKVGKKFDIKNVSDGFALNSLIPKGLARAASKGAEKWVETEKKRIEEKMKVQGELLSKSMSDIEKLEIEIEGKASEKGHLFASIHKEEIAAKIKELSRFEISAEHIVLEHPIKEAGEHIVILKVGDRKAKIKLTVKAVS
ncbi:MAG: 50S ribosomal protein L9 [bacterium]|nr:50S ribosomal protein L9 [bacterium]